MILVDTSVWVDWLRGKQSLGVAILDSAIESRETVATCAVVLAEIMQGLRNHAEIRRVTVIFNSLLYRDFDFLARCSKLQLLRLPSTT